MTKRSTFLQLPFWDRQSPQFVCPVKYWSEDICFSFTMVTLAPASLSASTSIPLISSFGLYFSMLLGQTARVAISTPCSEVKVSSVCSLTWSGQTRDPTWRLATPVGDALVVTLLGQAEFRVQCSFCLQRWHQAILGSQLLPLYPPLDWEESLGPPS